MGEQVGQVDGGNVVAGSDGGEVAVGVGSGGLEGALRGHGQVTGDVTGAGLER